MGSATSQVTASAGGYSASISFYPGTESWTYHHSESALSFSNFTADGSTNDLRPGNTRTLTAEVMSNTWDVWMSNYGNTENRNPATNPASSVNVGFSVQSGNGQISSGSSTTDSSGHASVGFTMGSQASTVQANGYDGTVNLGVITASLTFTLGEPTWNQDHTETTISTTLTSDGSTDMVPSGATRVVTANVSFNSWDVWKDDAGNTENRNYSYGGANNASIYFSVTEGDGTLTNAAYSTDSNGNATATFTMGTQASTVQADANYASASSSGTIKFTPDPWHFDHPESSISMSLAADDTTSIATATVTLTTWDVYSNGSTTEERNNASGPLGGATVDFSSDGDVTLGASSAAASTSVSKTTSPDGTATTPYSCTDGGQGNIQADTSSSGAKETAKVHVQNTQDPPTYRFDFYTQTSIFDAASPLKVKQPVSVKWKDKEMTKLEKSISDGTKKFTVDPAIATTTLNTAWNITYTTDTDLTRVVSEGKVTCKMAVTISLTSTDFSAVVTQGDPTDSWVATMAPVLDLFGEVSNVEVWEQRGLPDDQSWTKIAADKLLSYNYSIWWLNAPNSFEFKFSKQGIGTSVEYTMPSKTFDAVTVHRSQPQQTD